MGVVTLKASDVDRRRLLPSAIASWQLLGDVNLEPAWPHQSALGGGRWDGRYGDRQFGVW